MLEILPKPTEDSTEQKGNNECKQTDSSSSFSLSSILILTSFFVATLFRKENENETVEFILYPMTRNLRSFGRRCTDLNLSREEEKKILKAQKEDIDQRLKDLE